MYMWWIAKLEKKSEPWPSACKPSGSKLTPKGEYKQEPSHFEVVKDQVQVTQCKA